MDEKVFEEYEDRFGNMAEIAHPSIMFKPEFVAMLREALVAGTAITQEQLAQKFPGLEWEW